MTITEIQREQLWLGNAIDLRTLQPIFDFGIKVVVDVAYEELPAQLPRQLIYHRIPVVDGGGNDIVILKAAVICVVECLKNALPTLIGCSVGMSRSPTIASFALGEFLNENPQDIVSEIAKRKALEVNPTLWRDVESALGH